MSETTAQVAENFQYLKPRQVEELQREAQTLDQRIKSPLPVGGADRGDMLRRKRQIDKMLSEQQAPDLGTKAMYTGLGLVCVWGIVLAVRTARRYLDGPGG